MTNKFTIRRTKGLSWRECAGTRSLPSAGWKIHLSCHALEYADLLGAVEPFLLASGAAYKVAATSEDTAALNTGRGGESQIGKVLTVYCIDEADARRMALELASRWSSQRGPEIWNEGQLAVPSRIYLRYGGFRLSTIVDAFGRPRRAFVAPDGSLQEDSLTNVRAQIGDTPLTISLPPRLPPQLTDPWDDTLILIQKLNSSRHLTGLYLGQRTLRSWIVKAPRRQEARIQLENEHAVLSRLGRVSSFGASGFLQIEHLPGVCAEALPASKRRKLYGALLATVEALHQQGWVHRDLKWANVLINKKNLHLIDFELAGAIDLVSRVDGGTRGHQPPPEPSGANPALNAAHDVFSLGACLVHALLECSPSFLPTDTATRDKLLQWHGTSHKLRTLIRHMMDDRAEMRPTLAEARALYAQASEEHS